MHIIENCNARAGRVYCYVGECLWDGERKKYVNPRVSIGHIEGEPPKFMPNKNFAQLLLSDKENHSLTKERDRRIIDAATAKYGDTSHILAALEEHYKALTAWSVFSGPSIVFGGITSRYRIDAMLRKGRFNYFAPDFIRSGVFVTLYQLADLVFAQPGIDSV